MEKETRSFDIEFHSTPDSRTIEGRAIPFGVWSPNREGFREMIDPAAVEGVLEKSDIFMLYNHNRDKGFLARNNKGKGTLSIEVKNDGVYFSFDAKTDNLSNYIYERVKDGDLNEMSFAFTVENDVWEKQSDGTYNRTITKFDKLYDLSVVDASYYGLQNAVGCKRFAEIQEEERLENERRMAEEEEKKKAEEEAEKKAQEEAAEQARLENIKKLHQDLVDEYKDYIKK